MYVLIYLIKGELPWQGLKPTNKQDKNTLIMECKMVVAESSLCNNLPRNHKIFLLKLSLVEF
jgi:hypothetical protein